jgi:Ca2+-transporting ATPase
VFWVGLLVGAVCLGLQGWAIHQENPRWQTMVFTVLCLAQMAHVLAIRSETRSLFRLGLFSNPALLGAVALTFVLQMGVIYWKPLNAVFHTQPLAFSELLICVGASSLVFFAVELEKVFRRRVVRKQQDTLQVVV